MKPPRGDDDDSVELPENPERAQTTVISTAIRVAESSGRNVRHAAAAVDADATLPSSRTSGAGEDNIELFECCNSFTKLCMLGFFYFTQGLPFGFQSNTYPLLLRSSGVSRTIISLTQFLSAPWVLKFLWAPLIDSYPNPDSMNWIRRKLVWIVPQSVVLSGVLVASGVIVPSQYTFATKILLLLGLLIAVQNFFTASMDISVDGLAVDCLSQRELGHGNSVQVVAYKIGILVGGGLLAFIFTPNWNYLLMTIAVLVLASVFFGYLVADCVLRKRMFEKIGNAAVQQSYVARKSRIASQLEGSDAPHNSKEVRKILWENMCRKSQIWVLLAILLYKCGEVIGDRMFNLFLFDYGYSIKEISLYIGFFGDGCSIIGSFVGGFIPQQVNGPFALTILAILTVITQLLRYFLVLLPEWRTSLAIIASVVFADDFVSGMMTTVMFTFMMSKVDRRIAATHFTVFAVLETIGKSGPDFLSGLLTDRFGYTFIFMLTVVFEVVFLAIAFRLLIQVKQEYRLQWTKVWKKYGGFNR